MPDTTGMQDLRAEDFESMVKGFALQEFKMKQVVMVESSNAWIETYYRETATELTGGTGSAVRGIPRLANFPYGEVSWTKVQAYIEKYGMEGVIAWEDAMLDNISTVARTLLRIARAVAYAVDLQIYTVLEDAAGNSVAITAGEEWDSATLANRRPLKTLFSAKRELYTDNFDPDGKETFLILSPTDYANILSNEQVLTNPTFKAFDVVENGRVAKLAGLTIIVFNGTTADKALVCIGKECGTWKSADGPQAFTEPHKGISYVIRSFEMGVCQATTPNAIVTITNTQA